MEFAPDLQTQNRPFAHPANYKNTSEKHTVHRCSTSARHKNPIATGANSVFWSFNRKHRAQSKHIRQLRTSIPLMYDFQRGISLLYDRTLEIKSIKKSTVRLSARAIFAKVRCVPQHFSWKRRPKTTQKSSHQVP